MYSFFFLLFFPFFYFFIFFIQSEVIVSITSLLDMSFLTTSTNVIFDLPLPCFVP